MKEHLKPIPGETPEERRARIRQGTLRKVGASFTHEMYAELEELYKNRGLTSIPELIRVVMSEAVFAAKRAARQQQQQQQAPSTQHIKSTNNKQEKKN